MLVFKAQQIVAVNHREPKPWSMNGQNGTTFGADLSVFGVKGQAANIFVKAKTEDELKKKLSNYPVGKPADVVIEMVTPIFKSGDRKPSAYEYQA